MSGSGAWLQESRPCTLCQAAQRIPRNSSSVGMMQLDLLGKMLVPSSNGCRAGSPDPALSLEDRRGSATPPHNFNCTVI
jgi:hypothetical protein